ncbi:hypothetical protein SAMN05421770_10543 [Granulicella rosea]|uniref:Outer membrane protein beta-barrel domain-containing protein n=1 Tax=Granulicella rosea TaxID=474952 RepID=A0A239KP36_9BACT|nr:hypothetical protein [Granulicella rosea]SNT18944.1 hypothetical protein SAMN05421770_10543 [Granulicella rosea]
MNFSFSPKCVFALAAALCATTAVQAQVYKLHNADVAVGATGVFTTTLSSQGTNSEGSTDTTGFLFTLRDHPVSWAGVEVNYGYAKFTERFVYTPARTSYSYVRTDMHEATGAYLIHPHFRHLQPFIGLGGGAIDFQPLDKGFHQWRGTGLVELGLDIPAAKHMGFRLQARSLQYRAPNFGTPQVSSQRWVITDEPSASVYVRF